MKGLLKGILQRSSRYQGQQKKSVMDGLQEMINDLLTIELWSDQLKQKCYTTRKKLESFNSPAPRKGKTKVDPEMVARAIKNRMKNIKIVQA